MWFIRGTDGLTNRERRKIVKRYRERAVLTEADKKARIEWLREKLKEKND